MASDQEPERQRLAQLYASMTPEELENIASDAASLTDVARDALKAEIKRRGVSIVADESPLRVDAVEGRDLIVIKRLLSLPAALVARSRLESAGIECFMADDNVARIYVPSVVGGVKLLVSPENADAAAAILDEPTPEIPDSAGGE